MFEYMNPGFMVVTGMFLVIIILLSLVELGRTYELKTKFRPAYSLYIVTVISIVIAIFEMNSTKTKVLTNKRQFDNNIEIQCSTLTTSYIVSQGKGWRYLDKDHLSDGNIILGLQWCKALGGE